MNSTRFRSERVPVHVAPALPRLSFASWLAALAVIAGLALAQPDRSGSAGTWPARFASDDGAIVLYLRAGETAREGVMLLHGLPVPIEVHVLDTRIEVSIGTDVRLEGTLAGDELVLAVYGPGSDGEDGEPREDAQAGQDEPSRQAGGLDPTGFPTQLRLQRTRAHGLAEDSPPLLRLLSVTPDLPDVRLASSGIGFADLRAALWDDDQPAEPEALVDHVRAMQPDERSVYLAGLRRIRSGATELVQFAADMIERMPDLLGVSWFEIQGSLVFGEPPAMGTLLAVAPEATLDADLMERRGYAREAAGGPAADAAGPSNATSMWSAGEEGTVDFSRREPADPFAGTLGAAARIVELPGVLANARYTALAEAMAATAAGAISSLADAADFRALAEAIDATDGTLVQVHAFNPAVVGAVAPDPFAALTQGAAHGAAAPHGEPAPGVLPPYLIAALADLSRGPEAAAVVALVYADAASAERASEVLGERLRHDPATTGAPGTDRAIIEPSVHTSSDGLFVALAGVHDRPDRAGADRSAAGTPAAGGLYSAWLNALWQREWTVLRFAP